ncbi:hypothetical protein RDI58_022157 [Solanum bulbocastanum]|uniref:BED-type domain-containing protein n=1 Tax=Solanum bulbocastanum TaxID=147425 RepID=A0AAN8T1J1_SOLBU
MSTKANEDVHDESCEIRSSVPTKRVKKNTSDVWKGFKKLPCATSNEMLKAQCNVYKKIFLADSFSGTSNLKRHISSVK